ncbi:MAG: hypothetical protein J3R72DRAFT_451033 [Linnemannia gamsii]|nr:MAG: hypothetical protein J3R72DRAFT_377043 [Linnemannia gamsii]KAK3836173.1 MAG: hypothetical protein J3R72DRAFT_451033 [Linnemannia gamsii]
MTGEHSPTRQETIAKCFVCPTEPTFSTPEQERSHKLEYHSASFKVNLQDRSGIAQEITVRQVEDSYPCPSCSVAFPTKTACRRHLQGHCESNFQTEQTLQPTTIPDLPNLDATLTFGTETIGGAPDHDLAVISACSMESASSEEKHKTLLIAEALKLRPFTLRVRAGPDRFALAHTTVVERLARGQVAVCATNVPPKKRRFEEVTVCASCLPAVTPGLEQLLAISPYTSTLLTRTFVELDDPLSELLNEDWSLQPHLQYVCAQLLAGSIFLNTNNGQAIMCNTVEVYGRKPSVDAHRERVIVKKGVASKTSLPPFTQTRYRDVWPLTLPSSGGEQLLLGTQSFNGLITSSLRLDSKERASVGGSTSSFQLSSALHSAATRIFLDKEAVKVALQTAAKKDTTFVSVSNKLSQLRQLRSKFHDGSTFRLCRASGFLTMGHTCHPFSVFTLADFDQSQSNDAQAASTLFQEIAKQVLLHGSTALLQLDAVRALRCRCSATGNIFKIFDKVVASFPKDQGHVSIIGNQDLCSPLEELADALSSYINTANKSVITFVQECFPNDA